MTRGSTLCHIGFNIFQVLAGELPAELPTESLMKMKNMAELFEDVLLDKVEDLSEDLDSVSSIVVLIPQPHPSTSNFPSLRFTLTHEAGRQTTRADLSRATASPTQFFTALGTRIIAEAPNTCLYPGSKFRFHH